MSKDCTEQLPMTAGMKSAEKCMNHIYTLDVMSDSIKARAQTCGCGYISEREDNKL